MTMPATLSSTHTVALLSVGMMLFPAIVVKCRCFTWVFERGMPHPRLVSTVLLILLRKGLFCFKCNGLKFAQRREKKTNLIAIDLVCSRHAAMLRAVPFVIKGSPVCSRHFISRSTSGALTGICCVRIQTSESAVFIVISPAFFYLFYIHYSGIVSISDLWC